MTSAISRDLPALERDAKKAMELAIAKNDLIKLKESSKGLMVEKEKEIFEKAIERMSALGGDAAMQGKTEKAAPTTGPSINLSNTVLHQDFRIVGSGWEDCSER